MKYNFSKINTLFIAFNSLAKNINRQSLFKYIICNLCIGNYQILCTFQTFVACHFCSLFSRVKVKKHILYQVSKSLQCQRNSFLKEQSECVSKKWAKRQSSNIDEWNRTYLKNQGKGGGICLIVEDQLNSTEISKVIDVAQDRFITFRLNDVYITSCYMPDNSKSEKIKEQANEYLNTFLNELTDNPHILGDFHALVLDYGNNPDNNYDNTIRFQQLLLQNDLQILNDKKSNTCIHTQRYWTQLLQLLYYQKQSFKQQLIYQFPGTQ